MIDWHQVKLFAEHSSGISMDALHVLVGFTLFAALAILLQLHCPDTFVRIKQQ